MRVKVYLADGGEVEVKDFEQSSALALREALDDGESWLTLALDDDTTVINAAHVVRIDFDD